MTRNAFMPSLTLATLISTAAVAPAQESVNLRFSHLFPQTHYLWEQGGKVFIDELDAATGGGAEVSVFPRRSSARIRWRCCDRDSRIS